MYTIATGRYFIEIIMMSKIKLLMTALVTVTAVNAAAPTPKAYQSLTQDQQDAVYRVLEVDLPQKHTTIGEGTNFDLPNHKETINGKEVIVIDAGSYDELADMANAKKLLQRQFKRMRKCERRLESNPDLQSKYDKWKQWHENVNRIFDVIYNKFTIEEIREFAYCLYDTSNLDPNDQATFESVLMYQLENPTLLYQILATMIARASKFGPELPRIVFIPEEPGAIQSVKDGSEAYVFYDPPEIHFEKGGRFANANEFIKMVQHETGHIKHWFLDVWHGKTDVKRMMYAILNSNIPELVDRFTPMFHQERMAFFIQTILGLLNKPLIEETQTALIHCMDMNELSPAIDALQENHMIVAYFWGIVVTVALREDLGNLVFQELTDRSPDEILRCHPAEFITPTVVARLIYITSTFLFRGADPIPKSRIFTIEEDLTMTGCVPLMSQISAPDGTTMERISVVVDGENDYARSVLMSAPYGRRIYHNPADAGIAISPELFRFPEKWQTLADLIDYEGCDQPDRYYVPMLTDAELANDRGMFQLLLWANGVRSDQMAPYIEIAKELRESGNLDIFSVLLRLLEEFPVEEVQSVTGLVA
jgi:hypothetical protein